MFDITKTNKKINERNISKICFNFNNYSLISKKEIKENSINKLKIKNDEDNKDNSKNISYPEFLYLNKNSDFNLKMQNIKDIQSDNSPYNKYNKDNSNNNFLINNIINRRKRRNSNSFSNLKENLKNEIKGRGKRINKEKNNHCIVDRIKINWYQFLFNFLLKQCSNDIKLNLAKNGRKFYKQNLDIINVFKNMIMRKKLYEYILSNKKIFDLSDNNNISYFEKPIIYDNSIIIK